MKFNLMNAMILLSILSCSCAAPRWKMPNFKFSKKIPKIKTGSGSNSRSSPIRGNMGFSEIVNEAMQSKVGALSYDTFANAMTSSSSETQEVTPAGDTSSTDPSDIGNTWDNVPILPRPIAHSESSNPGLKSAAQPAVGSKVADTFQTGIDRVNSGNTSGYKNSATQMETVSISNREQSFSDPAVVLELNNDNSMHDITRTSSSSTVFSNNRMDSKPNSSNSIPSGRISRPNLEESVQVDPGSVYHRKSIRPIALTFNKVNREVQLIQHQQNRAELQRKQEYHKIQLSFNNLERHLFKIHNKLAKLMEFLPHKSEQ